MKRLWKIREPISSPRRRKTILMSNVRFSGAMGSPSMHFVRSTTAPTTIVVMVPTRLGSGWSLVGGIGASIMRRVCRGRYRLVSRQRVLTGARRALPKRSALSKTAGVHHFISPSTRWLLPYKWFEALWSHLNNPL